MDNGETMFGGGMSMFFVFMPWILISIPFAFGNYFLAERLGKNKILWAILTIVPFVNIVFAYYLIYVILFFVIDHLKKATAKPAE